MVRQERRQHQLAGAVHLAAAVRARLHNREVLPMKKEYIKLDYLIRLINKIYRKGLILGIAITIHDKKVYKKFLEANKIKYVGERE